MTREEIQKLSSSRMDELLPDDGGFVAPISSAVFEQELDEAARFVIQSVSRDHLYDIATPIASNAALVTDGGSITKGVDGVGVITLPADFVRFLSLKMSDWVRPVTELVSAGSEEYKAQFVRSIRGSRWKPVASLSSTDGTTFQLEYFSTEAKTHTIDKLIYVTTTLAENMPIALLDGLTWVIASRVLTTLQHEEAAASAMQRAQEALNIKVGLKGER